MATKTPEKARDCGLDGLTFKEPSLCQPQFADECNLSLIIKRFLKTGELPNTVARPTIDSALDAPSDLFEALEPAVRLRQTFDQLPLEERNRFNNDPEAWAVYELAEKPAQKVQEKPEDASEGDSSAQTVEASTEAVGGDVK